MVAIAKPKVVIAKIVMSHGGCQIVVPIAKTMMTLAIFYLYLYIGNYLTC